MYMYTSCISNNTLKSSNKIQVKASNVCMTTHTCKVVSSNILPPPNTHTPLPSATHTQVVILQSYWRQWLASRYVSAVREEKVLRRRWEAEQAARRERERGERQQREFQRRMNPRSKEDFDLLYHALESEQCLCYNYSTLNPFAVSGCACDRICLFFSILQLRKIGTLSPEAG